MESAVNSCDVQLEYTNPAIASPKSESGAHVDHANLSLEADFFKSNFKYIPDHDESLIDPLYCDHPLDPNLLLFGKSDSLFTPLWHYSPLSLSRSSVPQKQLARKPSTRTLQQVEQNHSQAKLRIDDSSEEDRSGACTIVEPFPKRYEDGIGGVSINEMKLLRDEFIAILCNKSRYKSLLDLRGEKAQSAIDALRMLLDHYEGSPKGSFVQTLLRLSNRSGLYPHYFTLRDIDYSGIPIATGNFGEIWKGNYRGLDVCLKIVKAYESSDIENLVKAYAKEAILWSQLSHPNLLPFYGIYHLNDRSGRICLVSPWMENGNVARHLQRYPDENRLLLLGDIAHGIAYLHSQNIVHGDLKGANVLVTRFGRACLADFGLSFLSDPDMIKWTSMQSSVRGFGGTIRWQAPELVDPENEDSYVTKESDAYAFACVAYELFTGNIPFYEITRDVTVILRVSRGEQPSRPDLESKAPGSLYSRGLTESMWNLMVKCWSKSPVERPTVQDVINSSAILKYPRPGKVWGEMSSIRFRREMENKFNLFWMHGSEQVLQLLRELQ